MLLKQVVPLGLLFSFYLLFTNSLLLTEQVYIFYENLIVSFLSSVGTICL